MKSESTRSESSASPELSVVIASFTSEQALARCLLSLALQLDGGIPAEVIVAASLPPLSLEGLGRRFPEALPGSTRGIRCFPAAQPGRQRGPQRAYDWALYFVAYGLYMPPWQVGEASILSGINVAYDRALIESCRPVWAEALRENEVHDALRVSGHGLRQVPEAWVKSHLEKSLSAAAAHLFAGGRHFGPGNPRPVGSSASAGPWCRPRCRWCSRCSEAAERKRNDQYRGHQVFAASMIIRTTTPIRFMRGG